ncbi:MAG: efflux RND transporter periplasmic adaptor subunit [Thauera sp.]|nr:efflux RND transporter periplasmic adaptor subunit [Thauera sp.]
MRVLPGHQPRHSQRAGDHPALPVRHPELRDRGEFRSVAVHQIARPARAGRPPYVALSVTVCAALALIHGVGTAAAAAQADGAANPPVPTAKPALTVSVVQPQRADWPHTLVATGNVAAWQEASISAEISNFRVVEVAADVGDRVRKGQVLARIADDTLLAELAQANAAVAEAEAALAEARANAERARQLQGSGAFSEQQIRQYLSAEQAALARLAAGRARVQADRVRLANTRILAPDDGIVSARSATVGSLAQSGEELFRLIRRGRLEWRAEVPETALGRIAAGSAANVFAADGTAARGRVRVVAPTVDPKTRNGLVYVDLAPGTNANALRAGMFARGEFELGRAEALTLPQSAVLLRDGFAYVFRVQAAGTTAPARVVQTKVSTGRRLGDRIEISGGLTADVAVVATGVGFLTDGDIVRVVETPAGAAAR